MAEHNDHEKENLKDYEGGYGGGRQRMEHAHEHSFGETGWSARGGDDKPPTGEVADAPMPKGVQETHGPDWQEKFARENSKKYGQGGGQPIQQRGAPQSTGGVPDEDVP